MNKFELVCRGWNSLHTTFLVFDHKGVSCGTLVILTEDVVDFIQNSWKGNIDWNSNIPDIVLHHTTKAS